MIFSSRAVRSPLICCELKQETVEQGREAKIADRARRNGPAQIL